MHIERYGTGEEQIVFAVHGWAGNHRTFRPLASHLPVDASLFAVDLPGYGQSRSPDEWRAERIVDALTDAARELPGGAITFTGLCSGAVFAMMAAKELPERAERIVMIDPFAYTPWYFRVFLAGTFGYYAYVTTFTNPIGRWLTNRSLSRRRTRSSSLTRAFEHMNHAVALAYLRLFASIDAIGPFEELRLPIDLIYGKHTFKAVKHSVATWRRVWPQARVWPVAGAGHLPIEEAPHAVAEILFEPVAIEASSAEFGP